MEDRPREKLENSGPSSLSDLELLAILLGTGTATDHVLDVAQRILNATENDIRRLAGFSIEDLMNIPGIGHVKAVRIKAAAELARRFRFDNNPKDSIKIVTSQDAFKVLAGDLGDLPHEEFWTLLLNRGSTLIGKKMISRGGLTSTTADPRKIFKLVIKEQATSFIVAHNHPSGSLNPSQSDIELTEKLSSGAKLLDLQLVDHLIISGNNYCSFADSGLL